MMAFWFLIFSVFAWPQDRWMEIENFDASISIQKDGNVEIVEKLDVGFHGSWNGIFRFIPYRYSYPNGVWGDLRLSIHSVEDENGQQLEYWKSSKNGQLQLKIRVPGAADSTRKVVIRYQVQDVLKAYGDHDEFYWNVTGTGWAGPIRHASADIRLPDEVLPGSVQTTAYTGLFGDRGTNWKVEKNGTTLHFETTQPLEIRSGLTVVVGFPIGYVAGPSLWTKIFWFAEANWPTLIPLAILGAYFAFWWYFGRDSLKGKTIIPEFSAPMELTPTEVGILADDKMHPRDLSAAIVNLAVHKILTIREIDGGKDFELTLREKSGEREPLHPFEAKLVEGLFSLDNKTVKLSSLEYSFYKDAEKIKDSVIDLLMFKKMFWTRPDKTIVLWIVLTAFIWFFLLVPIGLSNNFPLPFWIAYGICAIGSFILCRQMPRRTAKGLEALAKIKGLEEYLVTAEKDRMRSMPADHFEKLLPYAIALGVESRWGKAFEGLSNRQPDWYVSTNPTFSPYVFTRSMSHMSRSVSSNLYSTPRSSGVGGGGSWSGGSGFSGGGSSGGGFGGGGGGGW